MTKPDSVVWGEVLSILRTQHPDVCRQWFDEVEPIGIVGGVFEAQITNAIRRRYLEQQCQDIFNSALQSITGHLLTVRFRAAKHPRHSSPSGATNGSATANSHSNGHHTPVPDRCEHLAILADYTFENFVIGPENEYAHAAALAVTENPGAVYNPLYIHGGVGLGKTHLLQAICMERMSRDPESIIHYVSSDEFITQFMEAVQAGQMHEFQRRFRDVDMLVIDDIQFLATRDRSQEEFFHTFNHLFQSGKQIVLSSDAPPGEIPHLEDRLISRFKSGLVVGVSAPTYDTRVQIVKQKAKMRGLKLDDAVACLIASHSATNIRELEGAILKVQMRSITRHRAINPDLVQEALGPPQTKSASPEPTIAHIIDIVVDYYGVKRTELPSKRRQKSIARPRQVCMYLGRKYTRYSLQEIGGYFGGRDHTTVMHAVRTVEKLRTTDGGFASVIDSLEQQVTRNGARPQR